jgi:hypothetical protein
MNVAQEQIEVAARWKPYLDAINLDTSKWGAFEIYWYGSRVSDMPPAKQRCEAARDFWYMHSFKPSDNLADLVPPESLLLETVRALSPQEKKQLRDAVLAARAKAAV